MNISNNETFYTKNISLLLRFKERTIVVASVSSY